MLFFKLLMLSIIGFQQKSYVPRLSSVGEFLNGLMPMDIIYLSVNMPRDNSLNTCKVRLFLQILR